MTTRSIEEMAREIVDALRMRPGGADEVATVATYLSTIIKPGHVLTRDGDAVTVRKVLGTLCCTKDGAMVAMNAAVYHPDSINKAGLAVVDFDTVDVPTKRGRDGFVCESETVDVCECYSTLELAKSANPPTTGKREDV